MPPTTLNSEEPVISNEVGRDTDALCPFDQLLEYIHDDAFPRLTLLCFEYKRVILSSKASFVDTRCVQACAVGNACCLCVRRALAMCPEGASHSAVAS